MIDYRDDARWTVYVHIVPKEISNYSHDKYYVGITSLKPEHRWGCNGNGYSQRGHFKYAIQKYGWDNIQHEIIATHLTESEAKEFEKKLIISLDSNNSQYGYNMTSGGDGTNGYSMSEETKKKISCANKGKKRTPEEIERIRKNTPIKRYGESHKARTVYQFTKDGKFIKEYSCAKEAGDILNISNLSIGSVARKEKKSYKGFIWRYKEDVIESAENVGSFLLK